MTGNGHIELLKVTKYNFQPSRARLNSYIKLQADVPYISYLNIPLYVVIFIRTAFTLSFLLRGEIYKAVSICVAAPRIAYLIWPL